MMTKLPTLDSAALQQAKPYPSQQEHAAVQLTASELDLLATAEQVTRQEIVALQSGAARRHVGQMPVDLIKEGANMLELQMRQSRCVTPLSISSKATQAMLRQF
jgi:hypothetical protein